MNAPPQSSATERFNPASESLVGDVFQVSHHLLRITPVISVAKQLPGG